MRVSTHNLDYSPVFLGTDALLHHKHRNQYSARQSLSMALQICSFPLKTGEGENLTPTQKISGSAPNPKGYNTPDSPLSQANTVGIIGGVSVFSTLIFLEKLVWWSSRNGEECLPFVVCSDSLLSRFHAHKSINRKYSQMESDFGPFVENLVRKRKFLEESGARCIVMPCHLSHTWHSQLSEGCPLPFLHVADCVASELKEAELRPLEAGSDVRIGVLATNRILSAGYYQDKLQKQGFEVVLPDKATMDHIMTPAIEAVNRKDKEGARNLLRIAIHMLLVRAVNIVILASDELLGILPQNDPLLEKCIDPLDSLAKSTIPWAKSAQKMHRN